MIDQLLRSVVPTNKQSLSEAMVMSETKTKTRKGTTRVSTRQELTE